MPVWFQVLEICFLSSKTKKSFLEKTFLVPVFLFVLRNRILKTLNANNKNNFQRTSKWYSLCFQNQDPLMPYATHSFHDMVDQLLLLMYHFLSSLSLSLLNETQENHFLSSSLHFLVSKT